MKTTILIDGDVLAFEAAFVGQEVIQWDDELWTVHGDSALAKTHLSNKIAEIQKVLKADKTVLAFSHSQNFRKILNPDYKSNRKGGFRPILLKPLKEWMSEKWESHCWDYLEADDVLSILATDKTDKDEVKIIVSIDKDFNGVPVDWYNYRKQEYVTRDILDAERFHLIQCIAGDSIDGYKGIEGWGVKTAKKHLDKFGYSWKTVSQLYESKGLTEDYAIMTGWMARLLRVDEYNIEKKEIERLWLPRSYTPEQKERYAKITKTVTGKIEDAF
jgi:DNA polymerase-1|tara:strand:- start:2395 stop:3213 length:819 start_codon:yes stop_codon:yes gene_type:complete